MVDHGDNPAHLFSGLFQFHDEQKLFTLKPDALIHVSDIFAKVGSGSILDILNDSTDLKAELKTAKDSDEKVRISRRIAIKRLAAGVTEELDAVFKTLLK
jgi:hypothetical protein